MKIENVVEFMRKICNILEQKGDFEQVLRETNDAVSF